MVKKKLYPLMQRLKKIVYIVVFNIFKSFKKTNFKKIVLASNSRMELSGNLLYIYDYLKDNKSDYNIKIITKKKNSFLYNISFQLKCVKEISDAGYIIIDDYFPLMYVLKFSKKTRFVQVWHACGAFKKVGYSRNKNSFNLNSLTHKNYTDAIVSSKSIVEDYAKSFGIDIKKVHSLGVPRTDLFYSEEKIKKEKGKLYKEIPIIKDKRVILFAPTFRGNNVNNGFYPEEYIDLDVIYKQLKEDEIFIIKMHPFIKNKFFINDKYKDKIIDLTDKYREINNLLLITDLLITDYSSVIFEYAFLNKPIIFYTPDYNNYKENRDFYYDFDEYMYGIKCTNFNELIENLHLEKTNEIILDKFKGKFLESCDGKSTKKVVDFLLRLRRKNGK